MFLDQMYINKLMKEYFIEIKLNFELHVYISKIEVDLNDIIIQ